jgi:hypothetical protein
MGLFNDVKSVVKNTSKKIITKTGEYSQIARLTLDIKKTENDIERNHVEIGKYVINKIDKGETSLDLKDSKITSYNNKIKEYEKRIAADRSAIENLKKSGEAGT